ncbi:ABC transporter ATP-binding protein [Leekyejoonella antrihumi]|uniref:Spermidine/putrescine import ATP-binding protein PotA n=1 Tax=Leekyejoonella antrihumi TaxID=1660198 RepID=A0A563E123_9MICO|nr:ABC transporter ATP-binding protein [Leekyejoonella antrihumi]TWP36238.1 ABC transporter ATP-binding protein [Leekyejoonella antrihumi]
MTSQTEQERREAGQGVAAAAIDLRGVEKTFYSKAETFSAVRSLDLAIQDGEFFSLLGPSGCGKTTTLRMIAGFEEPTAGEILLHGQNMVGVPPYKRDVNTVFQSYALFPHMTVAENVSFGLERKRVDKQEIRQRVGEMLEIVGLGERGDRRPQQLSGGQQQRVALARALVNRPRALLLDEPLAALDLKLRQAMQVELKRIQREVGITFVFVTHDQGEALTMSDRLVVMNGGLLEQVGTPHELYERPATRFVAGFLGTSNIMEGKVTGVDRGIAVIDAGADGRVLVPTDRSAVGDRIAVSVRPEKIVLSRDEPAADDERCAVTGTVAEMVYLGTSNTYEVRLNGGEMLTVLEQNHSTSESTAQRGDTVWLTWRPQHSLQLVDEPAAATEGGAADDAG